VTTFVYPALVDSDQAVRDYLPPIEQGGPWETIYRILIQPMLDADAMAATLAAGLADVEIADEAALAALASRVGEPRGGLDLEEWRRLIAGALAARVAARAWSDATAWAMWRALTRVKDGEGWVRTLTAGALTFSGLIDFAPTEGWVERAQRVVGVAVPAGIEWDAMIGLRGALLVDEMPGLDAGALGWYLDGGGA
jgi:hypothetical protein